MRAILVAGALLVLLAPAAPAATRDQIIRDCADDGRLDGKYSASEIRDARKNLPADVDEYTDCRDVLRRAELPDSSATAGAGTPAGGSGGGSGAAPLGPASDAEQKALAAAARGDGEAVTLGGRTVSPAATGFAANAARHDLPWQIVAVLVLLAAGAVAAAVPPIRRRVLARRAQTA